MSRLGVGVLIAVRKDILSFLTHNNNLSVERLFVHFSLSSRQFVVDSVYLSSKNLVALYKSYLSLVELIINKHLCHSFIICGDYNIPDIIWSIMTIRHLLNLLLTGYVSHMTTNFLLLMDFFILIH